MRALLPTTILGMTHEGMFVLWHLRTRSVTHLRSSVRWSRSSFTWASFLMFFARFANLRVDSDSCVCAGTCLHERMHERLLACLLLMPATIATAVRSAAMWVAMAEGRHQAEDVLKFICKENLTWNASMEGATVQIMVVRQLPPRESSRMRVSCAVVGGLAVGPLVAASHPVRITDSLG